MRNLTFYRTKAASQFQARIGQDKKGRERYLLFWTAALPTGEVGEGGKPTFSWDYKKYPNMQVNALMGDFDIAEMLLVLDGEKDSVGQKGSLFHKNQRGNTNIQFGRTDRGLMFNISTKVGDTLVKVGHDISAGEAKLLRIYLQKFIEYKYFNIQETHHLT